MSSPEGTRKYTEHWRSGFYRIAHGAGVPVVPVFIDWSKKVAVIGDPITLTGDVSSDMDTFRRVLEPGRGKHPEQAAPVRLADEGPA